jgi:hypothetical protein
MARRGKGALVTTLILVGIIGIVHLTGTPRYQAYRAVDMVQLVGCGMCFGVALAWIIGGLRGTPAP